MSYRKAVIMGPNGEIRAVLAPKETSYADNEPAIVGGDFTVLRGNICGDGTLKINMPIAFKAKDKVQIWLEGDDDANPIYGGEIVSAPWYNGSGEIKMKGLRDSVAKTAWHGTYQARFQNYIFYILGLAKLPPGVSYSGATVPAVTATLKGNTPFELIGDALDTAATILNGGTWGVDAAFRLFMYTTTANITHRFPWGTADTPPGDLSDYANCVRFPYTLADGTAAYFEERLQIEIDKYGEAWFTTELPAQLQTVAADNPLEQLPCSIYTLWATYPSTASGPTTSNLIYYLKASRTTSMFDPLFTGTIYDIVGSPPAPPQGYRTPYLVDYNGNGGNFYALIELDTPIISLGHHDLLDVRSTVDNAMTNVRLLGNHSIDMSATNGINNWTSAAGQQPYYYVPTYSTKTRADSIFWQPALLKTTSVNNADGSNVPWTVTYGDPNGMITDPFEIGSIRYIEIKSPNGLNSIGRISLRALATHTTEPFDGANAEVHIQRVYTYTDANARQQQAVIQQVVQQPVFNYDWHKTTLLDGLPSSPAGYPPNGYYSFRVDFQQPTYAQGIAIKLPTPTALNQGDILEFATQSQVTAAQNYFNIFLCDRDPATAGAIYTPLTMIGSDSSPYSGFLYRFTPVTPVTNAAYIWMPYTTVSSNPSNVYMYLMGKIRIQKMDAATQPGTLSSYAYGLLRYRIQPTRNWVGRYMKLSRQPADGMGRFETPDGEIDLDVQSVKYILDIVDYPVQVNCGTPQASDNAQAIKQAFGSLAQQIRQETRKPS